ncbi:MAG: hypothetical protein R6X20_05510 [Phycisphaerae bacterium]
MTRAHEPTDADLRDPLLERLGDGVDPTPARRQALVDRIAAAAGPAQPRRRLGAWWIAVGAAAAAAIAAGVLLWPAQPEPIPPTALFSDLLGPLPNLSAPAPAPEESGASALPGSDALAAVWQDLQDPLTIVAQAVEAPRTLLDEKPSGPAPAGASDATKEN